jgi:hypothetical protein
MSEMIERVARAIARGRHGLGDSEKENALAVDYHWQKYVMDARAAIEAMREPSKEMMRAMFEAMFEAKFDGTSAPMIGAGFEAAIDAALQEPTK